MKERRVGPDSIVNMISSISIILWIVFLSVFILFAIANPTHSGMAASRPALKGGLLWLNRIIFGLLIIQVFLGVTGIIFNLTRLKRKTDRLRLTLVFSVIFGITGIIMMLV